MESWLPVIGGLVLLLLGAEVLVRGAVSLAARLNVSAGTIGLTVVAIGTSLPELVIAVSDCLSGDGAIAVGGVVGSNVFNIGAILGLSAVIYPVAIRSRTLKLEYPFMLAATLLFGYFASNDKILEPREGGWLLTLTLGFMAFLVFRVKMAGARRRAAQAEEMAEDFAPKKRPVYIDFFFVVAGIVSLHYGAEIALAGARSLAEAWGWTEHLIGLTIVAFGTSAPELAVSVVAAVRKRTEIAVGNIIGSCIFNLSFVLGIAACMGELPMSPQLLAFDFWWLLGVSVLMLPLMVKSRMLGRIDGAFLLVAFSIYYSLLFQR